MKLFDNMFNNDLELEHLIGLNNELKSIYINNYFTKVNKSILIVTNTLYEANNLYQSLSNYNDNVLLFPMDDFLTSEALAISPELKITRLETLISLINNSKRIIITNLMGYLRYLPVPEVFNNNILKLKKESEIDSKELVEKLFLLGYDRETIVNRTGEFASRGYVIDIFPVGVTEPIRIEFWGDTIDSIRIIDVDTQLTKKVISEITIYPNSELLLNKTYDYQINYRDFPNYQSVGNIFNYLNHGQIFYINYQDIKIGYERLLDEMFEYSNSINLNGNTKYMNDLNDYHKYVTKYFSDFDDIIDGIETKKIYDTKVLEHFIGSSVDINKRLNNYLNNKKIVIISVSSRYQANKIIEQLENDNIVFTNIEEIYSDKINLIVHNLTTGFILDKYVVISEKEIFNKNTQSIHYKTNFKLGTKIRDITKLNIGDYIVHSAYGIGIYNGIKTLTKNGIKKDYLMLQYKGDDKLYLPVEKIEYISKYSSNGGIVPKLNKLGGTDWVKTKMRVKKRIESIAQELLELYAKREAMKGFSFLPDTKEQIEFEKQFPYKETVDQLKAVEEIKKDMEKERPMDRLLCGDVGFGKTEVAFRAIFKAIMSGKQVAFLCPTTILSNQHYQNALERFKYFGVDIALVNRFVTTKELTKIKKEIKGGKIDLVIGTHRILSDDIEFKNLGLLVIDEEQRFGVKHKEKMKQLKNYIDVLTLSATPIPRTLQLSLAGLRNLSLIETPPVNRYPVQTYVMAKNEALLKDAIYKELSRRGQVFILYNHIDDMHLEMSRVKRIAPDARIIMAHGQMNKKELEEVMMKFVNHEYDILICTTIIETGIDIPNVNTLIIQDADHFGLSQLYQIRGRVGRSNKIAYCYLMYDPRKILSELAIKRLNVIKDFTELGSGFAIAMRDLSIRGAGDILGSEQAGFVDTVGIELFIQMLNEEIVRLKGQKVISNEKEEKKEPLLDITTSISDDYVSDEDLKIYIHQKINAIDSYEKLHETKTELEDRFGKMDEYLIIYMYEEWLEKLARKLNITDIKQMRNFIYITLPKELTEKVNGELLFTLVSDITRNFRFSMKGKLLVITLDTVKLDKHFIYYLIELMEVLEKSIDD